MLSFHLNQLNYSYFFYLLLFQPSSLPSVNKSIFFCSQSLLFNSICLLFILNESTVDILCLSLDGKSDLQYILGSLLEAVRQLVFGRLPIAIDETLQGRMLSKGIIVHILDVLRHFFLTFI